MIHHAMGDQIAARTYLQQALAANPYFSLRYSMQAEKLLSELSESN
jgi:hypothetical protein